AMQYALLIYTDEKQEAETTKEQADAIMAAYFAFSEQYKDKIVAGEALMPTQSATTVRAPEGKALTTDGPFAETKEQLGGFYLIEAANLDEAIEIAARIPGAAYGSIEVRPVMKFDS
ncbi:MAG TPA: YciI family protein, partial [Ktedonobacterales bacterium]|nr:YciI family protein [Ktedonobacterales bacterium]